MPNAVSEAVGTKLVSEKTVPKFLTVGLNCDLIFPMNDTMNTTNKAVMGMYPSIELELDGIPFEVLYSASADKQSVSIMKILTLEAKISGEDWYHITSETDQIERMIIKAINNVEQDFDDIGD
jgi:hypothetical protein